MSNSRSSTSPCPRPRHIPPRRARSPRTWTSGTDLSRAHADSGPLSAEELAALALAGHGPAWDEAVRRHTHRVVVALLARGVPLEAAEDLAQEAWIRLVEQQRAGRLRVLKLPGLAIAQACWLARQAGRTQARRAALATSGGALAAPPRGP